MSPMEVINRVLQFTRGELTPAKQRELTTLIKEWMMSESPVSNSDPEAVNAGQFAMDRIQPLLRLFQGLSNFEQSLVSQVFNHRAYIKVGNRWVCGCGADPCEARSKATDEVLQEMGEIIHQVRTDMSTAEPLLERFGTLLEAMRAPLTPKGDDPAIQFRG